MKVQDGPHGQGYFHLAGVSVRTLHYYNVIGPVSPAERTASGFRLYNEQDLQRLQQVLFCRELGFSLRETVGRAHPRRPKKAHIVCAVNFPADV